MGKRKRRLLKETRQKIVIESTRTGFSAHFTKLPVYSTGNSLGDLLINLKESVELYLEADSKQELAQAKRTEET